MASILFGSHQTSELSNLLQTIYLRQFILTAYVRPARNEYAQFKCQWRKSQSRDTTRTLAANSSELLICGNCWNGIIRIWEKPSVRARVPECLKCGAKVCGVEWDAGAWLGMKRGPRQSTEDNNDIHRGEVES